MATRRNINEAADDAADALASGGGRASSRARRAGADVGDAIDRASSAGATRVRRAARRASSAYDETADDFEGRVATLEDTIRDNPLAAAGAALLIGVVLGRFVL